MIGRCGERVSGISVQAARHDDDDDDYRLEERSVITSLVAEKCKPCEIYRRMCDVQVETYFRQKMFVSELNIILTR